MTASSLLATFECGLQGGGPMNKRAVPMRVVACLMGHDWCFRSTVRLILVLVCKIARW